MKDIIIRHKNKIVREAFEKETGYKARHPHRDEWFTNEYIFWMEDKLNEFMEFKDVPELYKAFLK